MFRFILMVLIFIGIATSAGAEDESNVHYDWMASNGSLLRYEKAEGFIPVAADTDANQLKDFTGWQAKNTPAPAGKKLISISKSRIFCLEACIGLRPYEFPIVSLPIDNVIEFDGVLIVSRSLIDRTDVVIDGIGVKGGEITSVFCAHSRDAGTVNITLLGERGSRLIFRFTGDHHNSARVRNRSIAVYSKPIDHFLDLKTMRWENQGDDPHFCESY